MINAFCVEFMFDYKASDCNGYRMFISNGIQPLHRTKNKKFVIASKFSLQSCKYVDIYITQYRDDDEELKKCGFVH